MKTLVYLCLLLSLISIDFSAKGQYQSLLWEVSGKDLKKTSYLYGTMHISGKLAFQLGDPFYDAIESADVVALELEPEAWLEALFRDPQVLSWLGGESSDEELYDEYADDSPLPSLRGYWNLGEGQTPFERLRSALLYEPDILNYLMFRYSEGASSVDFEEDTWLDMHIYQVAKKLGRQTIGLETYEQSDSFMRLASQEEAKQEDSREWDEGDIDDYEELTRQLEPAYRRQDLDLIDSLSRNTASAAFRKYILVERNKLFVHNLDSMLRAGQSVFAAMGCAHLPGSEGVIESLRGLGYKVVPISKGTRNAKRRKELDARLYNHAFVPFESSDGLFALKTPTPVYAIKTNKSSASWLSLDLANGANYTVTRLKSYNAINGYRSSDLLAMIDSMIYETVAGEIVSKKEVKIGGHSGFDVLNKTRRGDFQRQLLLVLPEEILVLKLAASGDKVQKGYGAAFFEDIVINQTSRQDQQWVSSDGALQVKMPENILDYRDDSDYNARSDIEALATSSSGKTYYVLQRHVIEMPDFLDEDQYELKRLLTAFEKDRRLELVSYQYCSHQGRVAIKARLKGQGMDGLYFQEGIEALCVVSGLSYIVLSTNETDSIKRENWFNSFSIAAPACPQLFSYESDELHYTTSLPYKPLKTKASLDAMIFNADLEQEQDSPFGTNAAEVLQPPTLAEMISVDFQRFHEYSDGENKEAFIRDKRSLATGIDMQVLNETIDWTESGVTYELTVGDTGTSRRFIHKFVLMNKSFYHLTTCYDSIIGISDFVKNSFENFKSTDTIFPYPHFKLRDDAYFNALTSVDSSLRSRALSITSEMDFTSESAGRIRTLLKDLPYFEVEDANFIKIKLLSGLASDTTSENIDFLIHEFNAYPDSVEYQYVLLQVLLQVKTARAWKAYARLVIEEPPIIFDEMGGSGCEALFDSLRIAAPLLPQLMQLLAIDEYEESIYHLMALAVDSGWLPVQAYRFLVSQIIVEARNELKRLNSNSEEGYSFNTDALFDYCTLLNPIRKEREVTSFFKKVNASRKPQILIDLARFELEHNQPLSDTLISRLARMNDQAHDLYKILREKRLEDRMPEGMTTRESLAKLYLQNLYEKQDSKADSVVLITRRATNIRGVKLDVFFYKVYKSSSRQWLGSILAFDNSDPTNAWPLFIESERSVVLDADEDEMMEMENEYYYLEELNREFVNFGSGKTDFSVQWY